MGRLGVVLGEQKAGALGKWLYVFMVSQTNVSAIQFEWAWQHPTESLAVRQAAAVFKSFSGVANKIKIAYTMLNLPAWQSLNITVNYFSTKYVHHGALCPTLPEQMKVQICCMENLPCYAKRDESLSENEDSLNAGEENEENEGGNPSIPGIGGDAANNSSVNDLLTVDETSKKQCGWVKEQETEQPSIIDDSLAKVRSFCGGETGEDAQLCGLFVYKHSTEVEKQRGTKVSAGSNVDEIQQCSSVGKQAGNPMIAAKEWSRNCFSKSNEVEVID